MSFETYLGGLLFLYIPVFVGLSFARGISGLRDQRITRRRHPVAFWLALTIWTAALALTATLAWANDPRARWVLNLAVSLVIFERLLSELRKAQRTSRLSATTRSEHPSAYWSAMFGLLLMSVVAFGLAVIAIFGLFTGHG